MRHVSGRLLHVISYKHYPIKRSVIGRYAGWLKVIIWLAQEPFKIRNLSANVGRSWVSQHNPWAQIQPKTTTSSGPVCHLICLAHFNQSGVIRSPCFCPELALVFASVNGEVEHTERPCFLKDVILHLVQASDVLLVCWPERGVNLDGVWLILLP